MNTPKLKCFIYVLVAALTCLSAELGTLKDFSELSTLKITNITIAMIIQSVVALKAFMDQSLSNKENASIESKEDTAS